MHQVSSLPNAIIMIPLHRQVVNRTVPTALNYLSYQMCFQCLRCNIALTAGTEIKYSFASRGAL